MKHNTALVLYSPLTKVYKTWTDVSKALADEIISNHEGWKIEIYDFND